MAHVAIPLASDFEDSEHTVPYERLTEAGHDVVVFGAKAGETVVGKRGKAKVEIEKSAGDLDVDEFDALVIPGGYSPDRLRLERDVVDVVQRFADSHKLVAAICHGPQLLIEADVVLGRTMTSWPSVRKDLENAGARWVDREVVVDENLVTSRKPEDLDAFSREILARLQPRRRRSS
jgi:protease I